MTVLASDAFNRVDNVDLGAAWDVITGESQFRISGNAAIPDAATIDCGESNNTTTWPDDQYSQALCPTMNTAAPDAGCGVGVRAAVGARTYYRVTVSTGGTDLSKFVAGAHTALQADATAWANGDTVYLSATGTALQVKRNGSDLLSASDGAITSGRPAVMHSSISAGTANLDDWEGGDMVGPIANELGTRDEFAITQRQG